VNQQTTVVSPAAGTASLARHRSIVFVQAAWLVIASIVLVMGITALPLRYQKVQARDPDLRAPEISKLIDAGVSPVTAARIDAVVTIVPFVALLLGGAILFVRGTGSPEALFLAITLVVFGAAFGGLTTVHRTPGPAWSQSLPGLLATVIAFLSTALTWTAMLWLPQGRFVSTWTKWFGALQLATVTGLYWLVDFPRSHDLINLIGLFTTTVGIAAQLANYRRVRDAMARQQIKWAVIGIVVAAAGSVITRIIILAAGDEASLGASIANVASRLVILASQLALVVCFWIAIRRYRLWPVDLVINQSLVYGAVTFALVAIFLGGGFALQRIIGRDRAPIAFALSITAAALAFGPARQQMQRLVDRRVYGFRFDLDELQRAQKRRAVKNPGLLTGTTLGAYRLLGVLGRGGMGEVYQGEGAGRVVAIKTVPGDTIGEAGFAKWFQREAEILAALSHPNIVRFHEAAEQDGIHYLVLEFIEGTELSALLRERRRLSMSDARGIIEDVTAALDYAHASGYVHRDIKPSNIMVRRDVFSAVVTDFGVAKFRDGRTAMTNTGAVGTIQYMAPEQIIASAEVDARADIYALGITLFETLTGEPPFKGNAGQLVFAHLNQSPSDPRELVPDLPPAVAAGIMRALQKRPDDRFQSVREFAAALSSY